MAVAAPPMKVGYVVLTYNRSDALLATLRGLAPQCGPNDVVVIADDGSRPEHVAALRAGLPRFSCPVRHVWHPDIGFTAARARNLGAAYAQAEYLIFLDDDCVPNADFVRQHVLLRQPSCFVNGSRVLMSPRLTRRVIQDQLELANLSLLDWLRLRLAGDVNKLTHLLPWSAAPGRLERNFHWKGIRSCNFGVWWRDFEAVNGFDETFTGWGHEDADLVVRLHQLGCLRKNGHMGTEVLHLWHPERSRARAEANRNRVLSRLNDKTIRAQVGLAEMNDTSVCLSELQDATGSKTNPLPKS
jgi:GT2 family glycosyltransferase